MTQRGLPIDQRTFRTIGEDGDGSIEPIPGMGVCDFCSGVPIVASYPCAALIVETPAGRHVSRDPWAACRECHALIEADDRHGLLARAQTQVDEHLRVPLRDVFAGIQDQFFMGRIGPPTLRN